MIGGRNLLQRARDQHGYAAIPAGLLVVLLIISAIRGPSLFTSDGLANALVNAAPLIMATLALTPIALAGRGGVDLSIGPLLGIVNVCVIHWLTDHGVTSPVPVVALAFGIAIGFEIIQGLLIATLRLQPIIVTLSGYLVLSGLALTILTQPSGTAPTWLAGWGTPTSIFSPVLYVIVGSLVFWTLIARTPFFHNIRLMGANERTAYASGIPLIATRVGAHAIAGVYAALGGLLYTALIASGDPTFGSVYTLTVVTALLLSGVSVAGGRGGAFGSVIGALDVFLITYVLGTFDFGSFASFAVQLTYGLILIGALVAGSLASTLVGWRRGRTEGAARWTL